MGLMYAGNDKKIHAYLGNTAIYRMYKGAERIYPNSGTVTYYVDTNAVYTEDINIDDSCLNPQTFTPTKSGYTFIGWREDTTAISSVLSSKIMDGNDVVLYAVFRQTITLSYNGNNATGGSTAAQTGYRYYNNGNVANPSFMLRSNGFTRTNYTFTKWAMGSTSGTQYSAGASVTLTANTVFYAMWQIVYTTSTAKHVGNGIRVGGDGYRAIGAGSTRDGGTNDSVSTKTLTGNTVSWYYSNNTGTIKANCACTVSIACSFTTTCVDGWTWYSYGAKVYKNNADTGIWIWNGGEMGGNGQGGKSYSNTVSISLNAGDYCEVRLCGGHDDDMGDRTGWYWTVTYTATPG